MAAETFSSQSSGAERSHTDEKQCWICHSPVGKRYFNRAHHCRICERLVCGACSPCKVMIEDRVERACTACASNSLRVNSITQQLSFLARQLADLSGRRADDIDPRTLEAALSCCEDQVEPLRKERVKHKIVERQRKEVERKLLIVQQELDSMKHGGYRTSKAVEVGTISDLDSFDGGIVFTPSSSDSHCWICGSRLGKRYLNPRHHCRLCDRPVCGRCSPSCITMEGKSTTQRACSSCMTNAAQGPAVKHRLEILAQGLSEFVGKPIKGATNLEEALNHCEVAFKLLKDAES